VTQLHGDPPQVEPFIAAEVVAAGDGLDELGGVNYHGGPAVDDQDKGRREAERRREAVRAGEKRSEELSTEEVRARMQNRDEM
jgi:hypothetical protein